MTNLTKQILELRSKGFTYNQIVEALGCSKGTVAYHLGYNQKEKTRERRIKHRLKQHPFTKKIENFSTIPLNLYANHFLDATKYSIKYILYNKIRNFCTKGKNMKRVYHTPTFTVDDVIKKFGNNPKCAITGDDIDLSKTRSYHFDHIIPISRGGDCSIDNLQIVTRQANQSKHDMTNDEFIQFCIKILKYKGYSINKQ